MGVLENLKNGKYSLEVKMPYLPFSSSIEERQQWTKDMDDYYEARRNHALVIKTDFMEEFGDTKTHRGLWDYLYSHHGCLNVEVLYKEFKQALDFINNA
jgi:hypothetical protein